MNADDLSIFVDVADAGSFASVARARHLDPSQVSRVVARLEAELGLCLFHRSTRSLALTQAGATYLAQTRNIPALLDDAKNLARGAESGPQGEVRLSVSHGFSQACLMPLMVQFADRYPQIKLNLIVSDQVLDLQAHAIDLAIRMGPQIHGDLIAAKLFDLEYRAVASPDWATKNAVRAPQDLDGQSVLNFDLVGFRDFWVFRDAGGEVTKIAVQSRFQSNDAISLLKMACAGLGPALLDRRYVANELAEGSLVDLFPHHHVEIGENRSAAWLVYPTKSYLPQKTRTVIDYLKAHLV